MTKLLPLVVLGSAAIAACAGRTPPAALAAAPEPRPAALGGQPPYTAADVHFVSGMISHHAQAVLIAGWAASHGASPAVQALCERIVVGQRDDIAVMQRWLTERGEPVPPADPRGHVMPGMDHPMLMPGMLTPEQLAQLDAARGPQFDRLFLTLMIQHHQGALTMVRELIDAPQSAREGVVFQIASDIGADQAAEIARMTRMLDALTQTQRSPQ